MVGSGGNYYDLPLTDRGDGTYDIGSPTSTVDVFSADWTAVDVPAGNPGFATNSILVAGYRGGVVQSERLSVLPLDNNGDVILAASRLFATIDSPAGATFDPVTGDLLVIDGEQVDEIRGFSTPEPASATLVAASASFLVARRRRVVGRSR